MFTAVLSAALTVTLAYLVYRRVTARRAVAAADTGSHALDWMNATKFWPTPEAAPRPTAVDGWQTVTVEDLTLARDMFDWLEATGYAERELVVVDNSTFLVRWR